MTACLGMPFLFGGGMRKLLFVFSGLALVLAWLLPNHYYPWTSFYNEYLAFVSLVFLAFGCAVGGVKVSWFSCGVLALSLVPLVQGLAGLILFFGDAFFAFFYLFSSFVALLVGRALREEYAERVFESVACVALLGAMVSIGVALYQWFEIGGNIWVMDLAPKERPYGNLAQPNNLATLLIIGLASLVYLFERRCVSVGLAIVVAAILIFGVVLTQSRTPWLAAIFFIGWWVVKGRGFNARVGFGVLLAGVGCYAAMVLLFPVVADFLGLSAASVKERAGAMQRLDIWWQMLLAIEKGGVWGYGWNQVSVAQLSVSLDYPVPIMVEHAHNIVLDLFVWNGPFVGGLLFLFGGGWLVFLMWRARSVEGVFTFLVVGVVFIHGFLEFPLEYSYFLLLVSFLLGGVEFECGAKSVFDVPAIAMKGIAFFGVLVLGFVWREYMIVESDNRLMRFEARGIGELRSEHKAPDVLLLSQLREYIRFARSPASIGMSIEEICWMGKVSQRYPFPPVLYRYALALGLNGYVGGARRQMLLLRSLYPGRDYEEGVRAMQNMATIYPQLDQVVMGLGRDDGE